MWESREVQFNQGLLDKLIRLIDYPDEADLGICSVVRGCAEGDALRSTFRAMGMDSVYPLGWHEWHLEHANEEDREDRVNRLWGNPARRVLLRACIALQEQARRYREL